MKVSVITPIYNTPLEYLQSYFNALNDQAHMKYEDIEICIINDGGVDPEVDLQSLSRFKVTYLNCVENHGPGHARQVGLNYLLAQDINQLIIFMDSDDQFESSLALSKYQWYYDSYYKVHGYTPDILQPTQQIWERPEERKIIDMYFPDCLHGLGVTSNFLNRVKVKFLNTCYHEDIIFTANLAMHDPKICSMDYITSLHRTRFGSISYFNETLLYDISRNVSVAQIITQLPLQYTSYIKEECHQSNNAMQAIYLSRLEEGVLGDIPTTSLKYQISEFAVNCHWKYLNGAVQEQILSKETFVYYADKPDLVAEKYMWLINQIEQLCADDSTTIKTYILSSLQELKTQYDQPSDVTQLVQCTLVAPVYNPEPSAFAAFLQSISMQSCAPILKLILVNDGSSNFPDNNFFDTYIPNVDTEIIHLNYNHGVGYARQIGLQAIQTPLFMLLDSDDEIATPYVVQQGIIHLLCNKASDGLVYYEQIDCFDPATDELIETQIINATFDVQSRLHGFMCRTSLITKYNLNFKPVQYGEDGLFIDQLQTNRCIIDTLPFVGYKHHKGYLTYSVYTPFANLNSLNDIYNHIYYSDNRLDLIDELLYSAEVGLVGPPTDAVYPMVLRPECFEDQYIRWAIKHYYGWQFVINIQTSTLHDLLKHKSSHRIQNCPFLTSLILQYLYYNEKNNVEFYYPKTQSIYTLQQLENDISNWVHSEYIAHKDNSRIPQQIMKNFPWNYNKYRNNKTIIKEAH